MKCVREMQNVDDLLIQRKQRERGRERERERGRECNIKID